MAKYDIIPVSPVGAVGAAPAAPKRQSITETRQYKDVAERAARAKDKLAAINKQLDAEPERALAGNVVGALGTGLALQAADSMAVKAPDGLLAKNPRASLGVLALAGLGGAYLAADKGMLTAMHAGMAVATTTYGAGVGAGLQVLGRSSAAPAPAPAPAVKGIYDVSGGSDPFELAGPLTRAAARVMARKAAAETPAAVEGPDPLENYIGEVLMDSGVGEILDSGADVGALPLMLAPAAMSALAQALPQLRQMAQAEASGQPAKADALAIPSVMGIVADLSGFDGDIGATMSERRQRRKERRIARHERKLRRMKAKAAATPEGRAKALEAANARLRAQLEAQQQQQAEQAAGDWGYQAAEASDVIYPEV